MNEIIEKLAVNFDSKIKLKGIAELLDGVIIHTALKIGYDTLKGNHPAIAKEFIELAEAYLQADKAGMIDEAADLLAAIVKIVYKVGK